MNNKDIPLHYVCTWDQGRELVKAHDRFWVCNCGCREERDKCSRSRLDVCLMFNENDPGSGTGKREATLDEVEAIFVEAKGKNLVCRPFRDETRTATDGICFCCDDCCGYFQEPESKCDRGELIEETNLEDCSHCGECAPVCYFDAREMVEGELIVDRDNCYGCGLCADVCPEECVSMAARG